MEKELKYIKTFESFSINDVDDNINESVMTRTKIKNNFKKMGNISELDDDKTKQFFKRVFELAAGASSQGNTMWQRIKVGIDNDKLSIDNMKAVLVKIKEDMDKNKNHGYVGILNGKLVYKPSVDVDLKSITAGGGTGGDPSGGTTGA